jgi:hypothetical protein
MHWERLVRASEIFCEEDTADQQRYFDYVSSRDETAWNVDEGPNDDEIEKLFRFLNQWRTRYPSDAAARASFKKAYLEVLPLLRALQGHTLLETALDGVLPQGMSVSEAVASIFEKIARSDSRYESTGTSKILHVVYPPLFVMWDSAIRGGYAVGSHSRDYAGRFLPRVQREAKEAVDSYIAERKAGPSTAVRELEGLCGGRALTKLIDEYNYCRFTLSLDELWR